MNLSNIVAMDGKFSSLISFSGSGKKRGNSYVTETGEIDTISTPKKNKVEPRK